MTTPPPLTWTLSCQDFGPDAVHRYRHFEQPERMFVYGRSRPTVSVRLTADEDGDLMGWWPAGDLRIGKVEVAQFFEMAFYERSNAAETQGLGRALRLRLEVVG